MNRSIVQLPLSRCTWSWSAFREIHYTHTWRHNRPNHFIVDSLKKHAEPSSNNYYWFWTIFTPRMWLTGNRHCLKFIYFRDIKLENILVDKKTGKLKLIDFGFCCCTAPDTRLKIFCGTPSYMCPEIVLKKEYVGPPTDIWAAGILLYALLCGHFPFKGASDKELYKKISRGLYTPPDHVSREAKQLLQKMLVVEPDRRHTA